MKTLTAREVSEVLKVNYRTVLNLIKNGTLPATKVGTKIYRVDEETLKNYMKTEDVNDGNSSK